MTASVAAPDFVVADPRRPWKAIAAAVVSVVTAGGAVLTTALADGAISSQEWVALVVAVVGVPALTGGATFAVENPAVVEVHAAEVDPA